MTLNQALIERDSPASLLGDSISITNPVANAPWASERSERWLLNSAETQTASWQGDVSPDALIGLRAREAVLDQGRVSLFLYRFAERGFDRVLSARDPITVHVDAWGNALLFEGLYRVVAAARFGVPSVPLSVKWFGGSELRATSWQPRAPQRTQVPEFSPLQLPGLITWLDAPNIVGKNDGDAITSWPNAVKPITWTGSGTFRTNMLNGYPAVRFNGTTNLMASTGGIIINPGLTNFSFGVVARWVTAPVAGSGVVNVANRLYCNPDLPGGQSHLRMQSMSNAVSDFDLSAAPGTTAAWFIALAGIVNGGLSGFWVNGKKFAGNHPPNAPYQGLYLASDTSSFANIDVVTYFILGEGQVLSDVDAVRISRDWGIKYNIPQRNI